MLKSTASVLALIAIFVAQGHSLALDASSVKEKTRTLAIDARGVADVLRQHIAGATGFKESGIQIQLKTDLSDIELPSGEVSFRIPKSFTPWSYKNLQIPVEIVRDGKPVRTFFVSAEINIRAVVLLVSQKIPYGKLISPDDIKVAETEIVNPARGYLKDPDEALGMIARRNLSPGIPLTRDDLANPTLVRTGDTVKLRFEKDGIRIATLARAEQSGQLGQYIRVRNLDFLQSVRARVIGHGEVLVE